MSSAGTVNGRGFVISYSVQTNSSEWCRGGYDVTIDSVVASARTYNNEVGYNNQEKASDSHKFFTTKISLAFSTGIFSSYSATGSGSMKYILGT